MARLSVNVNKVALLRNARHTGVPDVLSFARLAVEAGAKGVTVHPRQDERHIRSSDVPTLSQYVQSVPGVDFNIEGYPDERFLAIVGAARPDQCTLVPDAPSAFTSDKGWDMDEVHMSLLRPAIASLKESGSRVILFVDPGFSEMHKVVEVGADGIEIYTGSYAEAFRAGTYESQIEDVVATAHAAKSFGLIVNIGHDLNVHNIPPLVKRIPFVAEASIGHELTADALEQGIPATVRAYAKSLEISSVYDHEKRVDKNPFKQFDEWFTDAKNQPKSNAMTLATATRKGEPTARIVLLKEYGKDGLVFYTNYTSKKSRDLLANPIAALVFHWPGLDRQIRITGKVVKVSRKKSLEYFKTRSRESQLGAWASEQSSVIESRAMLDEQVAKMRKRYEGKEIPLPPHWGGFRLIPHEFEFMFESSVGRLHDRFLYSKKSGGTWNLRRLAP